MSTAGLESMAADEFIYQVLSQDPTLLALQNVARTANGEPTVANAIVYAETIPPDIVYPYVFFQLHTPLNDTTVVSGLIVFSRMDYLVKVVDRDDSYNADMKAIYARVHQLLHLAAGTVADGVVYYCQRMRMFRMPEITDAIRYRHLGGIYRLTVKS